MSTPVYIELAMIHYLPLLWAEVEELLPGSLNGEAR